MDLRVIILCILIKLNCIKSHELAVKIEIPLEEIEISNNISNTTLKSGLRYGFHQTHECQDYAKAYVCIQKCIDLNYDIAYSNKKCACFCITKKEKAKYTHSQMFTRTKWKLGAPSTTRPAWVDKYKTKSDKKKTGKKLVDKITVTEESTKAIINCTAVNNSDSCIINSNLTVESYINDNKLNDSNSTSAVGTPYKSNVSSSEIETPFNNSNNSSAAKIPTKNSDNSLSAAESLAKNSENSSAIHTANKNSENSSLVETPSKNSTNSSEVEDQSKNSGNSSAANMPSNNNDNSSAVGNNHDNSTMVEIPTKNNANSSEVVDPHKISSNSSGAELSKNSANASGVEPPQKNSANASEVAGSSNNE